VSRIFLERYTEERSNLAELVENILGRAEAEERDLVAAEVEQLTAAQERMAEIDKQTETAKQVLETRNAATDLSVLLGREAAKRHTAQVEVNEPAPAAMLGDFVESEVFRGYNGGTSQRVTIEARATSLRAPLAEGSAPGSALLPNAQKYVLPQGDEEFPLLDVIGRIQVSSNSLDMVTYGTPKGATGAAVVAEGATKPEAAITATATTVNIDTIAYWIQATRQLLQDAPAARGLIDDQLRRGLKTKLEAEVSAAVTGATVPKTTGASKETLLEVARTGMATVQAAGFRPNAILTSPANAAAFDLSMYTKTLNGAAYGVNPWGLQVIPVVGLAKTYVGDFRVGVNLLERTGIELFITDSHTDTFVKNIFTILAEVRAKAVVSQPAALTELVVTP